MENALQKQVQVRFPKPSLDQLRLVAESEGRTVSGQVRYWALRALREYFAEDARPQVDDRGSEVA